MKDGVYREPKRWRKKGEEVWTTGYILLVVCYAEHRVGEEMDGDVFCLVMISK